MSRFAAGLLAICLTLSLSVSAASAADFPAGYSAVMTTDFGKALFAQKPDATSVTAALQSTLPDLAGYFDGRPTVKGAYEDSKTHQSGGAVFTAMLKGQAMKGVISCKLLDKGAAVTVIYCRTDAPAAEWSKLTTEPPAVSPTTAPSAAPSAANALGDNAHEFQFPDGTGSVMLAEGWTTQSQSLIGPIVIKGPADQAVWINSNVMVQTPDSPAVQRRGNSGPQKMYVAEYTDPVEAMKDLTPQMSQMSQARGGPATNLDKILSQQDIPTPNENAKAAAVGWIVTRTTDGNARQFRGSQRIVIRRVGQQGYAWTYQTTGFSTPVESFDHDRPIAFAMINSVKVNAEVVSQKLQAMSRSEDAALAANEAAANAQLKANAEQFQRDQDQRFADGQARLAETKAGYDAHNEQFKQDQVTKARNKDDQVEHILGYRTVYDTQTGLSTTADLSDVTGVVNALNQAALDPNRFVQIPLRDEQDPR